MDARSRTRRRALTRPVSTLPPGEHSYEDVRRGVREGRYRFAPIRAASGRRHFLIGVSAAQLSLMRLEARRRGVGLILLGSRVSGPRLRQRELDPLLRECLPLVSHRRSASATYPGVRAVRIAKTRIKERGHDDPRTSDLSVMLISGKLTRRELARAARALETSLRGIGCSFPIRVFAGYDGRVFRRAEDFDAMGVEYLASGLPPGRSVADRRLRRAFRELYAVAASPRSRRAGRGSGPSATPRARRRRS